MTKKSLFTCLSVWVERPFVAVSIATVFYCLFYFILCGLPVIGTPTFRIDYLATTVSYGNKDLIRILEHARPISGLFEYIQGAFAEVFLNGHSKYIIYPLQHIALFVYFFSIVKIIESILNIKLYIFATLAAWFLFATNPGVIEGVYKLESIVGTLSMLFGGLSLVFLAQWDKSKKYPQAIVFILFYAFSIFAKEDFILPPLLLFGWYLVKDGHWKREVITHKWIVISVISLLVFFVIFNKFIVPNRSYMDPVNKTGHPYFMTLNPISVARVVAHYAVGFGQHIKLINLLYLVTTLTFLFFRKKQKEVLLIALIILGMIAPYSIMPNHIYAYYGLKWFAWQVISAFALIQMMFIKRGPLVTILASAGVLLLVLTNIHWNQINYFRVHFAKSENIQKFLVINRELINAQKQIAVVGVGPGQIDQSPWQGNGESEFYLRDDLQLRTHWIVFVETGNGSYTIDEKMYPDPKLMPKVLVKDIKSISKFGNIPKLIFDRDGHGRFVK